MLNDSEESYNIFGYLIKVMKKKFLRLEGFQYMTEILVIEFFKLSVTVRRVLQTVISTAQMPPAAFALINASADKQVTQGVE